MTVSNLFLNVDELNKLYLSFIKKKLIYEIEYSEVLVLAHISKAEHNLKLFSKLDSEFNDWKIIILYYSLYHCSLALILKAGFYSKNHTATLIFLIKHYSEVSSLDIKLIEDLQLKEEDAKFYTDLKLERHNASYSTSVIFDDDKIEEFKVGTINFLNKVKEIIDLN